jgi:predicted metal-dependent hydrolase
MDNMNDRENGQRPLIIAFIDDLMAATRVESAATRLGYRVKSIGRADMIGSMPAPAKAERPGEPVEGPMAALMEKLTAWQPALLIFDLANQAIPWRMWLRTLKSSPATRRIPVICYGPHVDKDALAEASAVTAEADVVVPRSRFFSSLATLLDDTRRVHDYAAIREECQGPLSAEALLGLRAFDETRYFEAHEHLENAWNADGGAARELYRAVLQVAVAYLQIERGNYRGAIKMFLRARQWLGPLPDRCRGIDIGRLKADAEQVHQKLVDLGPDRIDQFDLDSLPALHYDPGAGQPGQAGLSGAG